MSLIAIIEGNIRNYLNLKTDVMEYRLENYCKKCPVAMDNGTYTGVCLASKGGCDCKAGAKTAQNKQDCPFGFWTVSTFYPLKFKKYLEQYG